MQLNIKYFGLLAEITDLNEEQFEFSGSTISELRDQLIEKYAGLGSKEFQVAQNNEIVSTETLVSETEIALLPPFSGG